MHLPPSRSTRASSRWTRDQIVETLVQRLEARVLRLGGRCTQETSSQQQRREMRKSFHRRTPTVLAAGDCACGGTERVMAAVSG